MVDQETSERLLDFSERPELKRLLDQYDVVKVEVRGENENTWAGLRDPRALMLLSRNLAGVIFLDMLLGSLKARDVTFHIVGQ